MLCGGQAVAHAACPHPPPPSPALFHVGDGSKGTAGPLQFGTSNVTGVARMRLSATTPAPDFPSRFTLKPFPKKGNCKATVIIARWPPLALQNRRPLTDLVLTSICVSRHPPHNFPCEEWCWCRFSRRRVDPGAGSTGLQVTSSKSIRPYLPRDGTEQHLGIVGVGVELRFFSYLLQPSVNMRRSRWAMV